MKRGRKRNRLPESEKFVQLHSWLLNSAAWKAATVYERGLYLEIKRRYNGFNNGEIPLSHREAQEALNCSDKPVKTAFHGLMEKGFIKVAQAGSFHWKKGGGPGGRSTRWILTEYGVDYPVKSISPDRDFMRWRPAEIKNPRCDESTPIVGRQHTMQRRMVG